MHWTSSVHTAATEDGVKFISKDVEHPAPPSLPLHNPPLHPLNTNRAKPLKIHSIITNNSTTPSFSLYYPSSLPPASVDILDSGTDAGLSVIWS